MKHLYNGLYLVSPALSCPSVSSVPIGCVRAFSASSLILLESLLDIAAAHWFVYLRGCP